MQHFEQKTNKQVVVSYHDKIEAVKGSAKTLVDRQLFLSKKASFDGREVVYCSGAAGEDGALL